MDYTRSDLIMRRRERGNPKSPGSLPGAAGVALVRGRPPWVVSNFSECAVARRSNAWAE